MLLDLSSLRKAICSFDSSVRVVSLNEKVEQDIKYTLRAGVIQNFEFTYELSWKFMKRWLKNSLGSSYVEGVSRKELFRLASESGLINDVLKWMEYHDARNETSHTYEEKTAEDVFKIAKIFLNDAKKLLEVLESKND